MNNKEYTSLDWIKDLIDINKHNLKIYTKEHDIGSMQNTTRELKYLKQVEADLEILEILKKFFNFCAYYKKSVNGDFLEIIAKEDEEAHINNRAISFVSHDDVKMFNKWIEANAIQAAFEQAKLAAQNKTEYATYEDIFGDE